MNMTVTRETIRAMAAADAVEAADLLRRGDFGERLDFFQWALTQPAIGPVVAEHDGRIVGTGVASAHGRAGWVGVIFVAPERRGGGLGRRITRAVIEDLERRGCRTQILIASPMGRPIYEREGFTVLDRQVRFAIDGLPPDDGQTDPRIRAFASSHFDAVVALDRWATGEDRLVVLQALVTPDSTLVAVDEADRVRGYLARTPWRGGALIAPDPDDALRLLERRRRSTGISGRAGAGVLASNQAGRDRLRAAGWEEELGGTRMIRGEPLDWHPEGVFGQFNGALG
jgi:GNAT superfamily N-acetyltransferase